MFNHSSLILFERSLSSKIANKIFWHIFFEKNFSKQRSLTSTFNTFGNILDEKRIVVCFEPMLNPMIASPLKPEEDAPPRLEVTCKPKDKLALQNYHKQQTLFQRLRQRLIYIYTYL